MQTTIGITDTEAHYANYPRWIIGGDSNIKVIHLTCDNQDDLKKCEGLVLSGGVDSHPRFYGSENISYPNAPQNFNEKRDEFELKVFRIACDRKIPVLAICRGMQLVNIALSGDMLQDLQASGKDNHRKLNGKDGIHSIAIEKDSLLYQITNNQSGTVNSAHHQGLDKIADELAVNAWSSDGVAEGIEWKNKEGKTFLLGVQWHPERLGDLQPGNPLSPGVREMFLKAIKS